MMTVNPIMRMKRDGKRRHGRDVNKCVRMLEETGRITRFRVGWTRIYIRRATTQPTNNIRLASTSS